MKKSLSCALALSLLFCAASGCKKSKPGPAAPAPPPADTATPTASPTFTPTVTSSHTATATRTITHTPTITDTPAVTPTPYDTPSCASPVTLGSAALNAVFSMSGNLIYCARYTTAAPTTILSMTFNVTHAGGGLLANLGIYDEASGRPNNLLRATGPVSCLYGLNTFPLTVPLELTAGDYWLAASLSAVDTAYVAAASGTFLQANFPAPVTPGDLPHPAGAPATVSVAYALSLYGVGCP